MASKLEQDLSCSICHELFRDPVLLTCSHSFCKVCLENWWKNKPLKTCPLCQRNISKKKNPPLNLALRNLVETFREEREQVEKTSLQKCILHSEPLRLFCEEHQELVCVICRDSRTHKDHSFRPMEEAAQELREELRRNIKPLQDKLKLLEQGRAQLDSSVDHISVQARLTEKHIRAEFNKLQQFLREEEESRMKTLREEEEQKTHRMKDMMDSVSRDMETVSQTISETEEQLRTSDISFLLHYKTAVEKVQRCPLAEEPHMEPGALIDQAKHLGNLAFNVWRNMKSLVTFCPVILDPNSAGAKLTLSEDLTAVSLGEEQQLPKNPERSEYSEVLGSEKFVSGIHSWDVDVRKKKQWFLGVREIIQREEKREKRDWFILFFYGAYFSWSPSVPEKLLYVKNLQKVRVELNFDSQTLTFSDPDTNTVLLRETDTFTELTPYLNLEYDEVPLKILTKNITVTVEDCSSRIVQEATKAGLNAEKTFPQGD